MAEQATTKRWEMVAAVDLDDKKQLPKIALDADGYATALDAASAENVAAPVDVLRSAVGDNFATGGDLSGKKVFATAKASARQITVHDKTIRKFGTRGTTVFSAAGPEFTDSYALKTTTGGVLVVFAHAHPARRRRRRTEDHSGQGRPRLARHHQLPLVHVHVHLLRCRHRPHHTGEVDAARLHLPPHRRPRPGHLLVTAILQTTRRTRNCPCT